jgi:hypothetical protein
MRFYLDPACCSATPTPPSRGRAGPLPSLGSANEANPEVARSRGSVSVHIDTCACAELGADHGNLSRCPWGCGRRRARRKPGPPPNHTGGSRRRFPDAGGNALGVWR